MNCSSVWLRFYEKPGITMYKYAPIDNPADVVELLHLTES